jgi:hypothetical protein
MPITPRVTVVENGGPDVAPVIAVEGDAHIMLAPSGVRVEVAGNRVTLIARGHTPRGLAFVGDMPTERVNYDVHVDAVDELDERATR